MALAGFLSYPRLYFYFYHYHYSFLFFRLFILGSLEAMHYEGKQAESE